jgi:hypothetical protein
LRSRRVERFSFEERLRAILDDETLYMVRGPDPEDVGAPRKDPFWVWNLYNSLVSTERSAREVERELRRPANWAIVEDAALDRFPDEPDMWPESPMRRHRYEYLRDKISQDAEALVTYRDSCEQAAAAMAVEAGLLSGDHGSLTDPDTRDCIYADGKVVRALYNPPKPDPVTGEIRPSREPDAKMHHTGDGRQPYGTKFVFLFARGTHPGTRFVLSVDEAEHDEVGTALEMVDRLRPQIPGAKNFIYDGALRGTHIDRLMTGLGLGTISPMYPAAGSKKSGKQRQHKRIPIPNATINANGKENQIIAVDGAPAIMRRNVDGEEVPEFLTLRQVRKQPRADGTFRWSGEYFLPGRHGTDVVLIRFDQTDEDRKRNFNRAENLRAFPPSSAQYKKVYGRRSDAESSNRLLEDSLWLNRAHCLGARQQLVTMIGFQRATNAVAFARYRARQAAPELAA